MRKQANKLKLVIIMAISFALVTGCKGRGEGGEETITNTPPQPTVTEEVTNTPNPTITEEATNTPSPTITEGVTNTPNPTITGEAPNTPKPTEKPEITTSEYKHSNSVIKEGDFLFYKEGNLMEGYIIAKNLKTSKEIKLSPFNSLSFSPNDLFYKDNDIYFNEKGTIYRVNIEGNQEREQIAKGNMVLLGFYKDLLFYYNTKNKEITQIDSDNKEESRKVIAKLGKGNYREMVITEGGIYYINQGDNYLADGNPIDYLYYLNLDSQKSELLLEGYDIYDMKVSDGEVFFAAIGEERETFTIYKGNKNKLTNLVTLHKEEFGEELRSFGDSNGMRLLTVGGGKVYYGLDDFNNINVDVYSLNTDGKEHQHMFNIYELKDISRAAYFSRFRYDSGYLIMHFDCDEAPHETFIFNTKDGSYKKLEPGYYSSITLDIEGDSIYFAKSKDFDHYQEYLDQYEFQSMKLSEFLK